MAPKKRAVMTEEEKEAARAKDKKRKLQRRANLTAEEREAVRVKDRERCLQKRANMTEEEREAISAEDRERLKTFISRVHTIRTHSTDKYKAARAFINNSLLEIVSLHGQLEQLKMQLRKTLSEALASVVKRQIGEKYKTAELQSSTFVEIPLSLAADTITTFENVSDPLLLQTGQEFQHEKLSLSGINVDQQNEKDKIDQAGFQVFDHVFVSDNKSECTNTIKKLACSICSKKFGTSLGLTIHQREHNVNSNEFNCSICSKVFHTYNLMTTHYLEAHSYEFCDTKINEEADDEFERSLYEMDFLFSRECLICFKSLDSSVGLTMFRHHIIDHHSENKELLKYFTYICCRCDKPYAVMRSLEFHWGTICFEKRKNEDKTKNEIVCEQCGSKLSNEKSLSSHVKIFHTGNHVVCQMCGNQFKNQETLSNHVRLIHRAQYKFTCEHCSKMFKTGFCLKKHKESVHLRIKSFVCKFCSKRLANRPTWIAHEKSHTGERPYECKLCNKTFAGKSSLTNHEGIHTGFKCKTCDKTFRSYFDLCEHRQLNHRKFSNPDISREISCKICHKSFKKYMLLKLHKQNVHGKVKYVCEVCGKPYKRASAGYSHRFSHDNIIRYGCNLCEREFRHARNFYKHRKVVHVNKKAQIVNLITKTSLLSSGGTSQQIFKLECSKKLELEPALNPEQNSIAAQNSIETSQSENKNSPKQSETSNISKLNLERENSPALDDYFSDVEFDNELSALENSTTQFEIAELRDASPDLANAVFTSPTKDPPNSDDMNEQNSERSSVDQSIQSTVTSSRANVPLGLSELCDETANTQLTKENLIQNKESEHQHQVFIEDIEDASANFLLANVNIDDLVKLKTEKLGDNVNATSIDRIELHSDGNIDENDHECQEKSNKMDRDGKQKQLQFSPRLVVKLTRLSEYNCVPCDKTIFAVSEREIRIHRRTHRTTLSQNEEVAIPKVKKCSSNKSDTEMKGSYNCLYCDEKGFVRCRELVVHCLKEHPGKKPLKCELCPETFTCYKTLREHKSKVHDSNRKKCSSTKSDLQRKWYFDCLYCENKRFGSCVELVDHCSSEHPGKEPLRCKMCPEMFTSIKTMREHKAKVHYSTVSVIKKGKNEFWCELCGKKFNVRISAITHFLHNHQERKFKCDVCSKSFPTVKELERHQLRHLGTKPHLCENCGKAFFTPHELTDHIEVVHQKIFKRKRVKSALIKNHPFSCNICPYTFKQESGLKAHLKLHDPKRKFSCDECGLRYKFYTNVITHKNYRHKKNGKRNMVTTDDD